MSHKNQLTNTFIVNAISIRHVSALKDRTSATFKQQGPQNELPDVTFS